MSRSLPIIVVLSFVVGCVQAPVLHTSNVPIAYRALPERPTIYLATTGYVGWSMLERVAFEDRTHELVAAAGGTIVDEGDAQTLPPAAGDLVVRLALTGDQGNSAFDLTTHVRVFDASDAPVDTTPGGDELDVEIDTSRSAALTRSEDTVHVAWDGWQPTLGAQREAFEIAVGRRLAELFVARLLPELERAILIRSRALDRYAPALDVGTEGS